MKLNKLIFLVLLGLVAGVSFASINDQMTACNAMVIFYVWNDTSITAPDSVAPQGVTIMTGCESDLYVVPDTLPHMWYPDTLVFIPKILEELEDDGPDSTEVGPEYSYYPTPHNIMIPPAHNSNCCKQGIYAKARMFDAATSQYSPWVDINTTNMFTVTYVPSLSSLVLTLSMHNFKTRNLGGAMGFNCNVDTLILYVWDCDNADIPGTAGEFGVVYRTFSDGASLSNNRIYLHRYTGVIGINEKPQVPQAYSLDQNQPNPFNSATQIRYALPEDASVKIEITNILGNKIKTLVDGRETAGYKRVVWNGLDDAGKEVPSGVYFYTIQANDFTARNRAILMK